jgi:hypothetical protein
MRKNVKSAPPAEVMLTRVLAGLEQDLVDASDEDIAQAAKDLGMNLSMKGSAAFVGVKGVTKASFAEFFGPLAFNLSPEQLEALRRSAEQRVQSARDELRAKGAYLPRERKDLDTDEK